MPNLPGGLPRLECHFGWSDQATRLFKETEFESLVLRGGASQDFIIPDLGARALHLKALRLKALGSVFGLEQFHKSLVSLGVHVLPENGIGLNDFPQLLHLTAEWSRQIERQVHDMKTLSSLDVRYYNHQDISQLNCMSGLKSLSLSQGSVVSLNGVNDTIEQLDLSYLRNFTDCETLNRLTDIRRINCQQLKKAQGSIRLHQFTKAQFLRFVETGFTLDFREIEQLRSLEKIWSNGAHINLNWATLLSLPKLKFVGLRDAHITEQQITSLAQKAGKKITGLTLAGTRNNPHFQIELTQS